MPILAPLIIGAATVGAAAISSKASSSAAKTTSDAADKNVALQREIYGKNEAALDPFIKRGNAAGDRISALLNLGGDTAGAEDAFQKYLDSSGYKFQVSQGVNAVQQGAVSKGLLKSGAAIKGLDAFGQGIGSSYFEKYLSSLSGEEGKGLTGASALAGVGQSYGNSVANITTNAAEDSANSKLINARNISDLLGGVSSLAGRQLGTSSYGGGGGGSGGSGVSDAINSLAEV